MSFCKHLKKLEQALLNQGYREISRGKAWSKNCNEWVYFDCELDIPAIKLNFEIASFIDIHVHLGTHSGCEKGLFCPHCFDGIMGSHPFTKNTLIFSPNLHDTYILRTSLNNWSINDG